MPKQLLVSALLFGAYTAGFAQTQSVASSYPTTRSAADTVEAVHRLYRNRRGIGGVLVGLCGIAVIVTPTVTSARASPGGYRAITEGVYGLIVASGLAVPALAYGIYQLSSHSKKKEEYVIAVYLEKHILPRKLRKQLRPALFLPPEYLSPYR